jgi:hypothetical protein
MIKTSKKSSISPLEVQPKTGLQTVDNPVLMGENIIFVVFEVMQSLSDN